MTVTVAFFIALAVMLVGLAGTFVPAIPGLPLIWLAMLGFGFVEGFAAMKPWVLVVALAVVVLTQVAEHYAKGWGAKKYGAGKAGSWGAVLGSIAGLFFMPVGLILGPFLGAMIGELLAGRSTEDALKAGWGGLVGVFASVLVNVLVALGLTLWFVLIGIKAIF